MASGFATGRVTDTVVFYRDPSPQTDRGGVHKRSSGEAESVGVPPGQCGVMGDGDAADGDRGWCAGCGERVDLQRWHPVALAPAHRPRDVLVFCGPTCRGASLGERDGEGEEAVDLPAWGLPAEHRG